MALMIDATLLTPAPELSYVERRTAELVARHALDDTSAYAMACAGLTDWQVGRALQYMQAGVFFTAAIYEASHDLPPRPAVLPPHITLERARSELQAALCHYSLIRYIGGKGKDAPVIGVIVICPGRKYQAIKYNLPQSGILPRSKRWRKLMQWLRIEEEDPPATLEALEKDRKDLIRLETPWRNWIRLDPVQTTITAPRLLLNRLFEEAVMGKSIGTMSDREIEEQLEERLEDEGLLHELEFTPEEPDDHYMIMTELHRMNLMAVRYWMKQVREHGGRFAHQDKEKLKDRLLYLLTLQQPGLASVVKWILEDAQQVR